MAATGTYKVVAGDNLSSNAARFETTLQKLATFNGIQNPDLVRPGQTPKVTGKVATPKPAPKPTGAAAITGWTVDPGDTLTAIAAATGASVAQIQKLNGIRNPNYIQAGQTLRIR